MAAASNVIDLGKVREARQLSQLELEVRAHFARGIAFAAEHEMEIDALLSVFDTVLEEFTEEMRDDSEEG